MSGNYTGKFYEVMLKDLSAWVWNNTRLRQKITLHNLQYLFEFDKQRGWSIDLRRFEPEFYKEVFYPPEDKKAFIDEFVRKICRVISASMKRAGKEDLNLTITVRHMVSETSHWKTFYIDKNYAGQLAPLSKKAEDWFYSIINIDY